MEKYVKLFEEFDRPEELEGFKLVGRMSTDDFMQKIRNHSLEKKDYVYRLVNYKPSSELSWGTSGEIMKPIAVGDKKAVKVNENNMYKSPLIIFPVLLKYKPMYFCQNEDGTYTRYKGTSEKKQKLCKISGVANFSGISLSAYLGNRNSNELSDTEFLKLASLLGNVFDHDARHPSFTSSTRNYIGYIFDEVLIYEIDDTESAVETILDECTATIY